jgi:hypothetical protein
MMTLNKTVTLDGCLFFWVVSTLILILDLMVTDLKVTQRNLFDIGGLNAGFLPG